MRRKGGKMALISRPALLPLIVTALLLLSLPALGQGKCGVLSGKSPSPWLSVEAGGGVALPIPLSSKMKAKSAVAAITAGVQLHLPRRFGVGLRYAYKEFSEANSTFEYGRFHDLLLRGAVAAVMGQYVQWDFFLLAGPSFVKVRFMDIDPVNPQYVEQGGMVVPVGPIKEKQITAFTAGLGTRLAYYPFDALGLTLDVVAHYSLQASLTPEEGAMSVAVTGGLEGHF